MLETCHCDWKEAGRQGWAVWPQRSEAGQVWRVSLNDMEATGGCQQEGHADSVASERQSAVFSMQYRSGCTILLPNGSAMDRAHGNPSVTASGHCPCQRGARRCGAVSPTLGCEDWENWRGNFSARVKMLSATKWVDPRLIVDLRASGAGASGRWQDTKLRERAEMQVGSCWSPPHPYNRGLAGQTTEAGRAQALYQLRAMPDPLWVVRMKADDPKEGLCTAWSGVSFNMWQPQASAKGVRTSRVHGPRPVYKELACSPWAACYSPS